MLIREALYDYIKQTDRCCDISADERKEIVLENIKEYAAENKIQIDEEQIKIEMDEIIALSRCVSFMKKEKSSEKV